MNPTSTILLVIKATVILAAAFAIARTMRHASAASRYVVWLSTFAALLVVPALGAWAPLRMAVLPAKPAVATPRALSVAPALPTDPQIAPQPAVDTPSRATGPGPLSAEVPRRRVNLDRNVVLAGLVALWAAVALALCVSLLKGSLAVRRIVRRARPIDSREWLAALHDASDRLGLDEPPRLLRSNELKMPFACGLTRPTVVLPAGSDEWTPGCRRAVLLHELAHVRRRDLMGHTLARVMCALYWFHPLVWIAAKRLRVESEGACDDLALTAGERAPDYAEHLLDVVSSARTFATPVMALAMAHRADLESRLLDILDPRRARATPSRRQSASLAGILALIAIVVGAAAPIAAAPPGVEAALAANVSSPLVSGAGAVTDSVPVNATAAADLAPETRTKAALDTDVSRDVVAASAEPIAATESSPRRQSRAAGTWSIRMASAGETQALARPAAEGPIVHVALRTPGLNTFYIPLARLEGLAADQIAAADDSTSFRLRRDAGTLSFEGRFQNGRGRGSFDFAPDPAFADALARRGIGRPTDEQQFSLALHGLELAFVDALASQGYASPTVDALVRASMSSADLEYLRGMAALGYRLGTLDAIVRLSNHSLTLARVRALNARAGRRLSSDELLAAAMTGDATDSRSRERSIEIPGTGGRFSESESTTARPQRDITGAVIEAMRAEARRAASPATGTPLEGRWVIDRFDEDAVDLEVFWTDGTNWRRRIARSAFSILSPATILSQTGTPATFRIEQEAGTFEFTGRFSAGAGGGSFRFTPNRGFASTLQSLGVEGGSISDHDLKNLAWGGISSDEIQEFQALGFTPLRLSDATGLAIRLVTPQYVRAMQAAGVPDARTIAGVENLRMAGVTAEYVRELDALGYRQLSGEQLGYLRRAGVTPAFIRELQNAGERGLTVDELVRRARDSRKYRRIT